METETASESMQPTEEVKPRSFFSCLGGVYAAPGETFKDLSRSPGVLMPIIALVIIGMLATYFMSLKVNLQSIAVEQVVDKQVAEGRMTQQQADQLRERVAKPSVGGRIASAIFAGLALVLIALIVAAVAKFFCTALLGAENRFKDLFSVTLYVWLAVGIVNTVLFLIILYFKNPADITITSVSSLVASNLGALLSGITGENALPKFLDKLLEWVDVFAIWKIALLAIGYSAVSRKLKTTKAATWIVVVYAVIAVIGSAISSYVLVNMGL